MKEFLARFCVDNKIQPYSVSPNDLKNAAIKKGDNWEKINESEYKKLNNDSIKVLVKNDQKELEEIVLKNATTFEFGDPKDDKYINFLAKCENDKMMVCSTLDFMDVYRDVLDRSAALKERLDQIEEAAKEVGVPVFYLSSTVVVDAKDNIIQPRDVVASESITLYGGMTTRDGEPGPEFAEGFILESLTDYDSGYELTVLVAPDAVYVNIGIDRELQLEREAIGIPDRQDPQNEILLAIAKIREQEPELEPELEPDRWM